jgi:hypothetical protein
MNREIELSTLARGHVAAIVAETVSKGRRIPHFDIANNFKVVQYEITKRAIRCTTKIYLFWRSFSYNNKVLQ